MTGEEKINHLKRIGTDLATHIAILDDMKFFVNEFTAATALAQALSRALVAVNTDLLPVVKQNELDMKRTA